MNKKLLLLGIAPLTVAGLMWGPTATAATCGDGSDRTVDDPATEENEDTNDEQAPVGEGYLYAAGDQSSVPPSGYAGVGSSDDSYIELGGAHVVSGAGEGQSSSVGSDGSVCNSNL